MGNREHLFVVLLKIDLFANIKIVLNIIYLYTQEKDFLIKLDIGFNIKKKRLYFDESSLKTEFRCYSNCENSILSRDFLFIKTIFFDKVLIMDSSIGIKINPIIPEPKIFSFSLEV